MVLMLARVISTCFVLPFSETILASLQPGNHVRSSRTKSEMIPYRRSLGASIWNTDLVNFFSSSYSSIGVSLYFLPLRNQISR